MILFILFIYAICIDLIELSNHVDNRTILYENFTLSNTTNITAISINGSIDRRYRLMIIIIVSMLVISLIVISLNKLCDSEEISRNYLTRALYDMKDKDLIKAKFNSKLSLHTDDLDIKQMEVRKKSICNRDDEKTKNSSLSLNGEDDDDDGENIVDFNSDSLSGEFPLNDIDTQLDQNANTNNNNKNNNDTVIEFKQNIYFMSKSSFF